MDPPFETEDRDEQAQLGMVFVRAVSGILAVLALVFAVVPSLRGGLWSVLAPLPFLGAAWALLQAGRARAGSWLLVGYCEVAVTAAAFTGGGYSYGIPGWFVIGPVLGALLLGPRWGVGLTVWAGIKAWLVFHFGASHALVLVDASPATVRLFMATGLTALIGVLMSSTVERLRGSAESHRERVAAVARARDYANALLRTMSEAVLVADASGVLQEANAAAAALLGGPVPLGRPLVEILERTPSDRAETLLRGPSEAIPVEASSARLVDPEGEVRQVVVVTDLRSRVAAQQLIEAAARAAQAEAQLKTAFVAGMSHELRTPLNAILGFAELLMEDLDGLPARDARRIHRAGKHLLGLVNDVLDLAKIEAGRMGLELGLIDLEGLVSELARDAGTLATERGIGLVIDHGHANDLGAWWTDEHKLRQVVSNLLSNAIAYTDDGQVTFTVRRHPEELLLRVEDTGRGIEAERLDRLFLPFTRHDSETRLGSGTGLAVSAEFVRLLGGRVDVSSTLGVGSTFTVSLPRLRR